MAHGTRVNSTAYGITGGKCLVGGTEYGIKKGRTLIGGTGYDVSFLGPTTINITGDGSPYSCYVVINGDTENKYSERTDPLVFEAGEQVIMKAVSSGRRAHYIIINGVEDTETKEIDIDCTGKTVDVNLNYQSNNQATVLRINY